MLINANGLSVIVPSNQLMPEEGPKTLPLILDFSGTNSYLLTLENFQALGHFSMCQTLWVDLSTSGENMIITVGSTGQIIKCLAGTQGYYNVLVPNPINITFTCVGGPADVRVQVINVPIAGVVWNTEA